MAKKLKEKDAALVALMETLVKDHGDGSVMLGDSVVKDVSVISSGSLLLDIALGVGGYPKGRVIEIYGPESSGKTTLALHAIASAQKDGGRAAFIDAENALDIGYARDLGVDTSKLLFSQPDFGEQALQIAEKLIESGLFDVVVIDSVAALIPKAELDGEIGDHHIGLHARMMSQAMRKLAAVTRKANCVVIFINQIREKIGGMSYGGNETTTGGRALRFYSSVRLDIRRIGKVGVPGKETANKVKVKVAKNKVAPPFRIALFEISYGRGINNMTTLVDLGVIFKVLGKSGGWYSYNDERVANGREAMSKWLSGNKSVAQEIELKARQGNLAEQAAAAAAEDADETETEKLIEGEGPEVAEEETENG